MPVSITIATNNGAISGGEVMLFNIARALRSLGKQVTIIGPAHPAEVVDAAQDEGFATVVLPAQNRKQYIAQLRVWSIRQRGESLLWCNGLVPSFATAGQKNRIVHLHQIPERNHKILAKLAMRGANLTLIPSQFAAAKWKGSTAFHNWVQPVRFTAQKTAQKTHLRVGFLGRPSDFKGTQYLAQAVQHLNNAETNIHYQMVIGGESRFVPDSETQELKPALAALGENLTELGWVRPEDYFACIDIAVVPSNWDEVFGLVAAEAMSARIPLIVSDAGALPEVVGQGYPWVFSQGNLQELAQHIEQLSEEICSDSPLLEETLNKTFWRWQENFSPEAGKARINEILEAIK